MDGIRARERSLVRSVLLQRIKLPDGTSYGALHSDFTHVMFALDSNEFIRMMIVPQSGMQEGSHVCTEILIVEQ